MATVGRGTTSKAPASRTHGHIQNKLGSLIDAHLTARGRSCSIITAPGVVPRVRSDSNFRVPDLGVTCTDYEREELNLTDPVLLIEILSPSNPAEIWTNVWAYTTIPSVLEILIVHGTAIRTDLLQRDASGNWPERALTIDDGPLDLRSIGLSLDLSGHASRAMLSLLTSISIGAQPPARCENPDRRRQAGFIQRSLTAIAG